MVHRSDAPPERSDPIEPIGSNTRFQKATEDLTRPQAASVELPPGIRYHAVMEGVQEHGNNDNTCCEGQGTRIFGSLPEYVWSLSATRQTASPNSARDGFFVNLFTASTLDFNASVSEGTGFFPPAPAQPRPPPPLPPPPPQPKLSFRQVLPTGSWLSSAFTTAEPRAETLVDCQEACINSDHPTMCQGLTWLESTAGSPLCTKNCSMVPLPRQGNTGPVYTGTYNLSKASSVKALAECQSACLEDETCVQLTWSIRPVNPCVLYQSINPTMTTYNDAIGLVKCRAGSSGPHLCSHFEAQCNLFTSIDESCIDPPPFQSCTSVIKNTTGMTQFAVVGRQQRTQRDWIQPELGFTASPRIRQRDQKDNGTATIQVSMKTEFPYGPAVNLRFDWNTPQVTSIATTIRLRIPSWLNSSLRVFINQEAVVEGKPGTYLSIDRQWRQGDFISFNLSQPLTLFQYTGVDEIPGFVGRRYAVVHGPLVLGCTSTANVTPATTPKIPVPATRPADWLLPVAGAPLHYTVKGAPQFTFKPLWDVNATETFTIYPILSG